MNDQTNFELGLATVTSNGLHFNGLVYTCAAMVKKKWFEYAAVEGGWKVIILYDPRSLSNILIFEIESIDLANSVHLPEETEETHQYQSGIRVLKEQLRRAKRNK
jgi:hypothetical protein